MRNKIEFKVKGKYAIFTDPITKLGGEMYTYQIPTYEALKGIVEAIYWKPTIVWYIDRLRVINPIQTTSKSIKLRKYEKNECDLYRYTYLADVEYQVSAHFEWDMIRDDLAQDRNEDKHFIIANRYLNKGGKRDIFLGKRECVGFVEPCEFGSGKGFYDEINELDFGYMFHSFNYPNLKQGGEFSINLDKIVMKKGVIEFKRPEDCQVKKKIRTIKPNSRVVSYSSEKVDKSDVEVWGGV